MRVTYRTVVSQENRQSRLTAAFSGDGAAELPHEFGAAIARFCDEGRAAWPEFELRDEQFCEYAGARLAAAELVAGTASPADLFLACACVVGSPGASQRFVEVHRQPVQAALARIVGTADQEEILQRVWENLLVPASGADGDELPRVSQYKGRGPLRAFVRVAAVRLAISLLRKSRPVAADEEEIARLADDSDDPEVRYLKERYRDEFRRSFAGALDALPAHQQLLLRLDIVEELTIDQAALIYGRTRTTTGRHLLEARRALAENTLSDLRDRLGLASSELQSVARLVRSQIDLSVHRLLGEDC